MTINEEKQQLFETVKVKVMRKKKKIIGTKIVKNLPTEAFIQ